MRRGNKLIEDLALIIVEKIIEYSGDIVLFETKKRSFSKTAQEKVEELLRQYNDNVFYLGMHDYLLKNDVVYKMTLYCDRFIEREAVFDEMPFAEEFYEQNKRNIYYFSQNYIKLFFIQLFHVVFKLRFEIRKYSPEEKVVAYTKLYLDEVEQRLEQCMKDIKTELEKISINVHYNNIIANDKKFMFLETYENKLFLEDDESNALTLKDMYIVPKFVEKGKVRDDLHKYLNEFMFSQEKDNVLFIVGQPSVGKSSLVSDLIYKYRYRNDIIALPMKQIDGSESLLNGIRKELRCNDNDFENKILILDGYDETKIVKEKDANINKICLDFITDLQSITQKEKMLKTIMTVRTEFFDLKGWEENYNNVRVIELQDLDKSQIKQFIQMYSQKKKNSIVNLKLIRNSLSEKKLGIIANPMMLYMICYHGDKLGEKLDKALIYEKIFSKKGSLFTNIYKGKGRGENKETIEKYYKMIENFAFKMYSNNIFRLSGEEYLEYLRDNNLKQFAGMTIIMKNENEEVGVEFIHMSICHYFVAEYIYNSLEEICKKKKAEGRECLKIIDNLFTSGNIEAEIYEFLKFFIKNRDLVKYEEKNHVLLNSMEYILKRNCIYSLSEEENNVLLLDRIHNGFNNYWKVFTEIYSNISTKNKTEFLLSNIISNTNIWKSIARLLKNGSYNKMCFRGANFEGNDLRGAILRDSDLSYANLRNIDLRGASLIATKFNYSNLENANLNGADLCKAKFKNASLRRSKLRGCVLKECDFKKSRNVSEVKFSFSNIANVTNITEEDLRKCFVYNEQGKMLPYNEWKLDGKSNMLQQ